MATAASWLAPRAERTLERPLMPRASNRTATSSIAYLRMSEADISGSPFERAYG